MSTTKSPVFQTRLRKLAGGRKMISINLPKDEVNEIDQEAQKQGISRSEIIIQRYFLGKQTQQTK